MNPTANAAVFLVGVCSTRSGRRARQSCSATVLGSASALRGFRRTGWCTTWRGYVELIRKPAAPVQLLFWYLAVLGTLPGPAPEHLVLRRGVSQQPRHHPAAPVSGRAQASSALPRAGPRARPIALRFWAKRRQDRTGPGSLCLDGFGAGRRAPARRADGDRLSDWALARPKFAAFKLRRRRAD